LAALRQGEKTGEGQYVEVVMMDGVMNLCRVKFRDHQRLTRGDLSEYSVPTYKEIGRASWRERVCSSDLTISRSRHDGRGDESLPRQVQRSPKVDPRRSQRIFGADLQGDRKSVVEGKSVLFRSDNK